MSNLKQKELDVYVYFPKEKPILLSRRLICNAELVCEAKLEKGKSAVEKIEIERFKLRDIEQVMRNQGWEMGAKAQSLWFSGKAYQLPKEAKDASEEEVDIITGVIDNAVVSNFVDWNWLESFTIVKEKLEHLLMTKETLISKNIYDPNMLEYYGAHPIQHNIYSTPAYNSLVDNFKSDKDIDNNRFGYRSGKDILRNFKNSIYVFRKEIENVYFYHRYWQFQYIPVGDRVFEKPFTENSIEDWFAAFGSFTLNAAPYEIEILEIEKDVYKVNILQVAIYARDTFDFNGNQYLGFWNKKGVILPMNENFRQAMFLGVNSFLSNFKRFRIDAEFNSEVDYAINNPLLVNGENINKDLYFPVNNSDYRRWRENSKKRDPAGRGFGRDMILFSKMRIESVENLSIIVRISDERDIEK